MKKLLLIIALLVTFVLVFSGCRDNDPASKTENLTRPVQKEETPQPEADKTEESEDTSADTEAQKESEDNTEDKKQTPSDDAPAVRKSAKDIADEIKASLNINGALDLDSDSLCSLYGIDASDIKSAWAFVVMEGTFPHEAVIVEANNPDCAKRVADVLTVKYNSFVQQSKGYDAVNYELARKCRVDTRGSWVSMFLSPEFDAMNSVYFKYIK